MTRRTFIGSLCAAVASILPRWASAKPTHDITVVEWAEKYQGCRLLLDGVDITNRCDLANVAGGWASLIEMHPNGLYKTRGRHLVRRIARGNLEIVRGS